MNCLVLCLAYDAVGRLESDSRSGDAYLRTNYTYNVRSWLTDTDAGGVSDGKHSSVKESYSESEIVSAHEIGHLFGVSHSPNTVMSEHVGEYHKPRIEGFQIMEILQRSNVGIGTKPEKEAKAKVFRSTIVGEEPQGFGMGSVNKKEKRD